MKKLLILPILFLSLSIKAQTSIGLEAQAYPAGIIPGIRFDIGINGQLNLASRLGYNFTNRRDWGEHDKEEGGGFGLGLGIERIDFLTDNLSFVARIDLWFMDVDWRTSYSGPALCGTFPCSDETGTTEISVLQPTVGLAYLLPLSNQFFLKPSLSFGYEINVKTDGEPVGEGTILLAGFQLSYFF